jgi:siroheme synthase
MIHYARQGLMVARVKSGDPGVFGRLGEELEALRAAKIRFEIIPGVTAVAAAAASAELTLTDRRSASTLTILAGHSVGPMVERRDPRDPERTTFAIYMPGPDYGRTARELMEWGIDASTPCAVVSNACRPNQQVRFLQLAGLGSAEGIVAPAVLIVGRIVSENPDPAKRESDPYCYEEAWGLESSIRDAIAAR